MSASEAHQERLERASTLMVVWLGGGQLLSCGAGSGIGGVRECRD